VNTSADFYTAAEQSTLLGLARQTLEAVATGSPQTTVDNERIPVRLLEPRACFVTLYNKGELRGCTGTLQARRSLVEEVVTTTIQTAINDPRFPPVSVYEVANIHIEISVLTPSKQLRFNNPDELVNLIRPNIDGVTLKLGPNRSTFLPQVWEKIPDPVQFLNTLSRKMGLPAEAWRHPKIEVETYQSISIEEPQLE
jgi:uncharacterized protein